MPGANVMPMKGLGEVGAVSALSLGLRLAVTATLASAGISSLARPAHFARVVGEYRMLPDRLTPVAAYAISTVEIIVAAILPFMPTAAASAAAILISLFSFAILVELLRGRIHDCGCVGIVASSKVGPGPLLRNAALIMMLIGVIVISTIGIPWLPPPSWASVVCATTMMLLGVGVTFLAGWLPDAFSSLRLDAGHT